MSLIALSLEQSATSTVIHAVATLADVHPRARVDREAWVQSKMSDSRRMKQWFVVWNTEDVLRLPQKNGYLITDEIRGD